MGVLNDLSTNTGLLVKNAYHRIDSINGTQERMIATFAAYPSREVFNGDPAIMPLTVFNVTYNVDLSEGSVNFFKQAYVALKEKPSYQNAVDVLEDEY